MPMLRNDQIHPDKRIRDAVNHHLAEDEYVDGTDMEVTVRDGAVTLVGSVASVEEVHRAEALVATIPGVTQVTNHLGVRRTAQAAAAMAEIGSSPSDADTHTTGVIGDMNEPATLKAAHTNSLTRR
ncbi:MAG TPA: BON domain-containing protein [Azospirillum sp.]|nr:BON domain-containing protein [Azospirillum sp.]